MQCLLKDSETLQYRHICGLIHLQANFELGSREIWHRDCPNKHDYNMSDPSEFLILPADFLVIVNVRQALFPFPGCPSPSIRCWCHCHEDVSPAAAFIRKSSRFANCRVPSRAGFIAAAARLWMIPCPGNASSVTYLRSGAKCRNAFDWAPSMYRTPWGAREHCNISWDDFLRAEWSPGSLPGLLYMNCPL
jgi:hypothetical protein